MSETPEPEVSARGFQHHEPVPSGYGGHVQVSESSAAFVPHIWVRTTCPSNLNDPESAPIEAVAHLTLENATLLRDQLTQLIENHYQVRS